MQEHLHKDIMVFKKDRKGYVIMIQRDMKRSLKKVENSISTRFCIFTT